MSVLRFALLSVIFLSSTLWASVGKVALLKGEAVAERNAQTITLQNGSLIEDKDAIKTGKEAQIQLLFEDKTVITLGSESEFKIEEYLNDATNPKAKFKFNQGTFKTITGQIGKTAPQNFTMETKTSTIGIRGTIVKGTVRQDGDVIACLRGRIFVLSRATGKMVEVLAGQFTTIKGSESPTEPQETKPGTTDDSLANAIPTSFAPTTVSSVEKNKNDFNTQTIYSTPTPTPANLQTSGILSLQGYASFSFANYNSDFNFQSFDYFSYDYTDFSFSIDRATGQTTGEIRGSTTYSFASPLNGTTFSISGSDTVSGYPYSYYAVSYYDPSTVLANSNDEYGLTMGANMTAYASVAVGVNGTSYAVEDFMRQGFINTDGVRTGYMWAEIEPLSGSEYVSWGVWGTLSADTEDAYEQEQSWLADQQYWVAGSTITPESKIASLMNQTANYTYTGQVLGKTYNGSTWNLIDTASSDVKMIFNFGRTSTINSASYITFTSNGGDSWTLKPTSSQVSTTGFHSSMASGTNGGSMNVTSGWMYGKFFGSDAQAVGGMFSASANSAQAVGVFKAVR